MLRSSKPAIPNPCFLNLKNRSVYVKKRSKEFLVVNLIGTALSAPFQGLAATKTENQKIFSQAVYAQPSKPLATKESNFILVGAEQSMVARVNLKSTTSNRSNSESFKSWEELIVVENSALKDFSAEHNLQFAPIFLRIKQLNQKKHYYFLGFKNNEVWQIDWGNGPRRVTRIGVLLKPTDPELAEFESYIHKSRVIAVIQPTSDLPNGSAVTNTHKESFAINVTSNSLYMVERTKHGPTTITQLGKLVNHPEGNEN